LVAEHLASCPGCRDFAALLEGLSGPEAASGGTSRADYFAADLALQKARAVSAKQREIRRFAVFLALALVLLSGMILAGACGYGVWILGFQAAVFLVLPFIGLAILRRRAQGDAQWT